jgi:hypothetical protein
LRLRLRKAKQAYRCRQVNFQVHIVYGVLI